MPATIQSASHRVLIGCTVAAICLATACGGDIDGMGDGPKSSPPPITGEIQPGAQEVELAAEGEATMPVVIGENADPTMETAAGELAEYLEKISGASFEVTTGVGQQGIVVGTPGDFDSLPFDDVEFQEGPFEMEDYVLRSTSEGLYLLGSTPLAARFAVWELLYRLGHRQFFPTDTWEVIPERDQLSVALDVREEPDYYSRQAPRGAMSMHDRPWAQEAWQNWQVRNRTMPTFTLETGHAYDSVVEANKSAFDNNDEYWGMIDGERTEEAQPNVAHPDVQQMFVDHALGRFEEDPSRHSVAMDPRDGNYWSESPESREIGGPSEQATFMANRVAEEVVGNYGDDKYVGMYGYSHHSPPPEMDVHPNVIVSLATAYIRGGYTFEEMLEGWSEKTELIGIREYYGIWEWDYSLPGNGAKAANTEYLKERIPYYHEQGARFINAESNDTWGGYGLGYYLSSRMLWDVDAADRMEALIDDFVDKAFGPARKPMAEFYELIDGSSTDPNVPDRPRQLNDDMVGRMYRLLDEARDMAGDNEDVRARIDDLILYTRYVELYRRFDEIEGADRQKAFDELVGFTWRIRDTMMTDSLALSRYIDREVRTDDNLEWGAGYDKNRPADRHREGADESFSDTEIETILENGIADNQLLELDVETWNDSGNLESAGLAAAESDERGELSDRTNRGPVEAVLGTDDGTLPAFTISAGHIYDNRGPVQWTLEDQNGNLVDHGEVPPDQEDRRFELSAPEPGVYRFSIENADQGFVWDYEPRGAKMSLLAGAEHGLERNWFDRLYFYVPEGTDEILLAGSMLEGRYEFIDAGGRPVDAADVETMQDHTRVPVPEGQDDGVWSLDMQSLRPEIRFLNIPGYVAFSPEELLLPEEVVDQL